MKTFSNGISLTGYAPLLIVLGLLYSVSSIIRSIVLEKELRQKELMKMMSVTESDIGWSWFTSYFVFHIITSICCAIASASLYDSSSFGFSHSSQSSHFVLQYQLYFRKRQLQPLSAY
jgi:branched-subunit amino acid ABC-type transport system permease component